MPREMFGDVVDPSIKVGSQKWYTVPLSIIAHVVLFGAVIIIPLMATDVLPTPPSMMAFVAAPFLIVMRVMALMVSFSIRSEISPR